MSSDAIDPAEVQWDSGAPEGSTPQASPPDIDPAKVKWDAPPPRWNAGDELVNGLLFGQAPRAQAMLSALGYKAHAPLVDIPKLLGSSSTEKNAGEGKTYAENLADNQAQQEAFAKAHPYQTAAADTVGNIPGLMAGGAAANAGIRAVGTLGPRLGAAARFLTGEAGYGRDVATTLPKAAESAELPVGERVASLLEPGSRAELRSGVGVPLTSLGTSVEAMPGIGGWATRGASRLAATAREGAQAGAMSSVMDEEPDTGRRTWQGALAGGAASLATPTILRGLAAPASAYSKLPDTLRHGIERGAGFFGVGGGIFEAPEIWHMVSTNPLLASATLGTGVASTMARYLARHPDQRDAIIRWGVRPAADLATNTGVQMGVKGLFAPNTSDAGTQ